MYPAAKNTNQTIICDLLQGKNIPAHTASRFFNDAIAGDLSLSTFRASLILLAQKGETTDELLAAWNAIRNAEINSIRAVSEALDTCGTGGDGSHSINLSTLSSFVMAAAGVTVVKHGNRAITSLCGSSDLLEAFGMNLNQSTESVTQSSKEIGMGYFHAPHVHPVYSRFQALRRSIQTRTLFNLLGPVLNPVQVKYQILGIANPALFPLYSSLLPKLGRKSALIVLGSHGMDEVTSLGTSVGLKLSAKKVEKWSLNPMQLGFKIGRFDELKITSIAHAKKKAIEILKLKKSGAALDSVILSAACGIWIAGKADSIPDAIQIAKKAIYSGQAWAVLNQLIQYSLL